MYFMYKDVFACGKTKSPRAHGDIKSADAHDEEPIPLSGDVRFINPKINRKRLQAFLARVKLICRWLEQTSSEGILKLVNKLQQKGK